MNTEGVKVFEYGMYMRLSCSHAHANTCYMIVICVHRLLRTDREWVLAMIVALKFQFSHGGNFRLCRAA